MLKRSFLLLAIFALTLVQHAGAENLRAPTGVSEQDFKRALDQTRGVQIVNRAIYDLTRPSTVQIIKPGTEGVAANDPLMNDPDVRRMFGLPPRDEGQDTIGSGFIIDDTGLVLTNRHVVGEARTVQVKLADGRIVDGTVRGADDLTDIALIQLKNVTGLRPVKLGDSDQVKVGDYVVAVGNPFGFDGTFTTGVVSAVAREVPDKSGLKFIQTDASINMGNSGGPLIDLDGEVIGINRMIASPSGGSVGIGFAIPINVVKKVMARPMLGVHINGLSVAGRKQLGIDQGVIVLGVTQSSGAFKAGVEKNDIITKVDDKPVPDPEFLAKYIQTKKVGDTVSLQIVRNRVVKKMTVTLGSLL